MSRTTDSIRTLLTTAFLVVAGLSATPANAGTGDDMVWDRAGDPVAGRADAPDPGAPIITPPDGGVMSEQDVWLCMEWDYSCVAGTGYNGQSVWGSWGPGHNCVSYAAYRLERNGASKPWSGRIGNAIEWDDFARGAGIPVDRNPVVGSIAQWDTGGGGYGHIAYVEEVHATYIVISEDSYITDTSGYTSRRQLDRSGSTFAGAEFIHIKDQGLVVEGSFVVRPDGAVFRIAGGAPLYVTSWDPFGGPQPTIPLTDQQFASLPRYPADGAFISTTGSGRVYRFAGGAPIYVSNWDAVGGPQPATLVDAFTIEHPDGADPLDHVRQYPADGTFVSASGSGMVYRFAGGAPIYVSNWDAVGGLQPSTLIDAGAIAEADGPEPWNHIRQYPADGTFVSASGSGMVYRFAGGAPIYVSNWDAVGGPQPSTLIDAGAIAGADGPEPWNHIRHYPADGTFVSASGSGMVYRFAGGAPIYVSNWDAVGGPQPSTLIDAGAIAGADGPEPWNHIRQYPADGTFIQGVTSGRIYRVAGGSPLRVRDCAVLGFPGCGMQLTGIDQAAIDDIAAQEPWNHLRRAPKNRTVVHALPSGKYWKFVAGERKRIPGQPPTAVQIEDSAIKKFPIR